MRTIDLSKYKAESGIQAFFKNIQGSLKYGFNWRSSRRSQEELIEILDTVLGNEVIMLRDVNIPRVELPIPMVMIAPSGLHVINPKSQRGFYRAEGKRWEELGRNDEYQLSAVNLIRETWLYHKTIEGYFKQHRFSAQMDRGVMIFVNPETHVETIRPRVRVIRADGITNFAREVAVSKPAFSDMDLREAVKLLTKPRLPKKEKKPPPDPELLPDSSPPPTVLDEGIEKITEVTEKARFTRREWAIIGSLIALVIVVLVVLIAFIVLTL